MRRRSATFGRGLLARRGRRLALAGTAAALFLLSPVLAASDPGRLFFTPAQRAQLEAARTRNASASGADRHASVDSAPPPLRYDGVVIRSDGQTTRWVDGQPRRGEGVVPGLKPGQIRADGKVYEPYQILPSLPAPSSNAARKESAP